MLFGWSDPKLPVELYLPIRSGLVLIQSMPGSSNSAYREVAQVVVQEVLQQVRAESRRTIPAVTPLVVQASAPQQTRGGFTRKKVLGKLEHYGVIRFQGKPDPRR